MRMHSGAQKPIKKPLKHRLERAEILGALIEADIYRYKNHSIPPQPIKNSSYLLKTLVRVLNSDRVLIVWTLGVARTLCFSFRYAQMGQFCCIIRSHHIYDILVVGFFFLPHFWHRLIQINSQMSYFSLALHQTTVSQFARLLIFLPVILPELFAITVSKGNMSTIQIKSIQQYSNYQ